MQKSISKNLKLVFLLFIFWGSSFFLRAHSYYFAFAEVEYNDKSSKLEATLILTTHDFEEFLRERKLIKSTIDKAFKDSLELTNVTREINGHLQIFGDYKMNNLKIDHDQLPYQFKIEGFNVRLDGNLEIYMSADLLKPETMFTIVFDLLMEKFPDQQNKLTLISRNKKQTLNFTLNNQFLTIDLN